MDCSASSTGTTKMNLKILLFLFLLLIPLTTASFNCQLTNDVKYCNKITNFNINESLKEEIISGLLYNYTSYPDHEFIKNYNEKISGLKSLEKKNFQTFSINPNILRIETAAIVFAGLVVAYFNKMEMNLK